MQCTAAATFYSFIFSFDFSLFKRNNICSYSTRATNKNNTQHTNKIEFTLNNYSGIIHGIHLLSVRYRCAQDSASLQSERSAFCVMHTSERHKDQITKIYYDGISATARMNMSVILIHFRVVRMECYLMSESNSRFVRFSFSIKILARHKSLPTHPNSAHNGHLNEIDRCAMQNLPVYSVHVHCTAQIH